MANTDIDRITEAAEDAITYPILTKEVTLPSGRDGAVGAGGLPGSQSVTQVAQNTIRGLLGWRYRVDDSKGFVTALTKAVQLKEAEGSIEWSWQTRPFMVQADMGDITGAQASLYARAKVALDNALPLLNNLKPLRADADPEAMASITAMVRSGFTRLVEEIGLFGGPRIQRVDEYFSQLLGAPKQFKKPEDVKGMLGMLSGRFGMKRGRVLSVDDEQNFTNFIIVADYINSLCLTWQEQKEFLSRNGSRDKFLGTQLVWLSQSLAVIGEAVQEFQDAADSVFFGPEECQIAVLDFAYHEPITLGELMDWITQFTSVEAPQLIEDSGKDGVVAVAQTLNRLHILLRLATHESRHP
jgi:hypothetical protein